MAILDVVISLLVLLWLGGFLFRIGGGLIHILIVLAVIGFIFRLLSGNTAS